MGASWLHLMTWYGNFIDYWRKRVSVALQRSVSVVLLKLHTSVCQQGRDRQGRTDASAEKSSKSWSSEARCQAISLYRSYFWTRGVVWAD